METYAASGKTPGQARDLKKNLMCDPYSQTLDSIGKLSTH
jgi:hypothetical protein